MGRDSSMRRSRFFVICPYCGLKSLLCNVTKSGVGVFIKGIFYIEVKYNKK